MGDFYGVYANNIQFTHGNSKITVVLNNAHTVYLGAHVHAAEFYARMHSYGSLDPT